MKIQNKRQKKRLLAGILAWSLAVSGITGIALTGSSYAKEDTTIESPKIGNTTVWKCVYFGQYPQSEITVENDKDLYQKLQQTTNWDANGDAVVEGQTYRRVKMSDAVSTAAGYDWGETDTYHYFKFEPIKWRVAKVEENRAYLVSDCILDTQKYNEEANLVTWEQSTLCSWLNGHDATMNQAEIDYTTNNFHETAFNSEEWTAIEENNGIKVGMFDENAITNTTFAYGFTEESAACAGSAYAFAMGLHRADQNTANWWIVDNGNTELTAKFVEGTEGIAEKGYTVAYRGNGVRVAISLDLSNAELYSYAGTVSSDGEVNEAEPGQSEENKTTATPETETTEQPGTTASAGVITAEPNAKQTPEVTGKATLEPTKTSSIVTMEPIVYITMEPQSTKAVPTPTQASEKTATPEPQKTAAPTATPQQTSNTKQTAAPTVAPTTAVTPVNTQNATQNGTASMVGNKYQDDDLKAVYIVTDDKKHTLEYAGTTDKNKKTIVIPDSVKISGVNYKITSIAPKAFLNHKSLVTLTIGKNVKKIGAQAMKGCTALKNIKIKTTSLTAGNVGKGCVKSISSQAKIRVPKSVKNRYKNIFKARGLSKKARFGVLS